MFGLTSDEARSIARNTIESLEFWLRRFIHDQLSQAFSANYINAQRANGQFILRREIRDTIDLRIQQEPQRFTRPIDATLFNHLIDIICKLDLYQEFFKPGLVYAFPIGNEEARYFLQKLLDPRNRLSHANPISTRNFEQIICYSNDIIESLKTYYSMLGQELEYNVPKILSAVDHFGNFMDLTTKSNFIFYNSPEFYLWPGDLLTINILVDPSFDEGEYSIYWYGSHIELNEKNLQLTLLNVHVSQSLGITCRLTTNKEWHKHQHFDDQFHVSYRVLPPE